MSDETVTALLASWKLNYAASGPIAHTAAPSISRFHSPRNPSMWP